MTRSTQKKFTGGELGAKTALATPEGAGRINHHTEFHIPFGRVG